MAFRVFIAGLAFRLDSVAFWREDEGASQRNHGGVMQAVSPVNLALSLLFGVGQIVVGALFLAHGRNRWRRAGVFLLMLAGAWCICSGVIELFVSGMESVQRLSGSPDQATFSLWRGRADTGLAIATGLILLIGLVGALSGKLSWRRNASSSSR